MDVDDSSPIVLLYFFFSVPIYVFAMSMFGLNPDIELYTFYRCAAFFSSLCLRMLLCKTWTGLNSGVAVSTQINYKTQTDFNMFRLTNYTRVGVLLFCL